MAARLSDEPDLAPVELEIERLVKQAKILEGLVSSPGWREFERVLRAQIDGHIEKALEPMAPDGEFRKGAVFGLRIALATPGKAISTAAQLREERRDASRGSSDGRKPTAVEQYELGLGDAPDATIRDLSGE